MEKMKTSTRFRKSQSYLLELESWPRSLQVSWMYLVLLNFHNLGDLTIVMMLQVHDDNWTFILTFSMGRSTDFMRQDTHFVMIYLGTTCNSWKKD